MGLESMFIVIISILISIDHLCLIYIQDNLRLFEYDTYVDRYVIPLPMGRVVLLLVQILVFFSVLN